MKKTILLKSLLLLCALIVGSSYGWADETDVINNSATSSYLGSTSTTTWASDFTITGTSGAQYTIHSMGTSGTTNALQWNKNGFLYAKKSGGKVKSVTINGANGKKVGIYGANSAYSAKATATLVNTMTLTGSAETYDFTGAYEYIAINGTEASTSITSITIVWSTGPEINANNVNLASDATDGEISYTISNPDGSTLTAAEKSPGYDWIDNVVVDLENKKVTFDVTENTGAERSGIITLTYGEVTKDVTITQAAAVTKYTVTIETPSNGTLVVKRAGTPISTAAQIPDGTTLTIELTPDDGYRMRNWQAVDATTHTYTSSFSYTINAHDVTIKANFEVIPEHTATFYVNGAKNSDADVKEGESIVFPVVSGQAGLKFMGWTTAAIVGAQTTVPATLVTEATMSTSDVDYYAVFYDTKVAEFDASDITDTPLSNTLQWTHTATGTSIKLSAGQRYTAGTPNTFTVTAGTSNYLQVTAPTDYNLKKVVVTVSTTTYKINSVSSGASLSSSSTTQTVTFSSDMNSVKCYASTSNQIRAKTIEVTAQGPLGYCTTIPSTSVTTNKGKWTSFTPSWNATLATGAKAYIITAVSGDNITATAVDVLKKGEGYFIKGTDASTGYTVTASAEIADATTSNKIVGCTSEVTINATTPDSNNKYVLGTTGEVSGLFLVDSNVTVAAGKAYLNTKSTTGANTLSLDFVDGGTTGINNINNEVKSLFDGDFYNLKGQRVAQPTKGLYIINGRKVVIK